ncbi:MAG TPA: zeta toxin family protein [Bacteroidales bacterium]|jgi:predicted ABC-type ATPase|nr:zeta toxin family protein [Bacteroidales bacterium]HKM12766.1 zeta toxin family protein [Bacteroidales bacterium]HPB88891.1 zeta toxin family protein [Bacteroidales bacterium]HPY21156.1 zeta toxin family protein [Bacteroidales bacterium]HQA92417.1 zeta toxin family protein [Bacteroidales bacterium]
MPRLYIIAGCNGAGKTTASYTILPDMLNCDEFVNSDEIAKRLSPNKPEESAVRASRLMMERIEELIDKGETFGVETTLATRTLVRVIAEAQQKGYVVTLVFFWLKMPELAVERVKLRVEAGGHYVPEATIRRRYDVGIRNLFNLYIPVCDYWIMIDNSNNPSTIIAEGGTSVVTKIHNKTLYNLLINYERTRDERT